MNDIELKIKNYTFIKDIQDIAGVTFVLTSATLEQYTWRPCTNSKNCIMIMAHNAKDNIIILESNTRKVYTLSDKGALSCVLEKIIEMLENDSD